VCLADYRVRLIFDACKVEVDSLIERAVLKFTSNFPVLLGQLANMTDNPDIKDSRAAHYTVEFQHGSLLS